MKQINSFSRYHERLDYIKSNVLDDQNIDSQIKDAVIADVLKNDRSKTLKTELKDITIF